MFYSKSQVLTNHSEAIEHVRSIPIPEKTKSYSPVPHEELINKIFEHGKLAFHDVQPTINLSTAKNGNQMFGALSYSPTELVEKGHWEDSIFDLTEMNVTVGFRNSYDKSLAVSLALGANVLVCDNLQFTGDLITVRKHTSEIYRDLDELIEGSIRQVVPTFYHVLETMEQYKRIPVTDNQASWMLGQLVYRDKVLTATQGNSAFRDWKKKIHGENNYRTLYKVYQACTDSLKKGHPAIVADQYIKVDKWFEKESVKRYDEIFTWPWIEDEMKDFSFEEDK
jgi:hypothetical protein